MADHIDTGELGEQLACQYLLERGLTVLHRNWRSGRNELDIVAREGKDLVVVEVKTRSTDRYGLPQTAIGHGKRNKLYQAAEAYLEAHRLDLSIRFDVVSIVMGHGTPKIQHIREAFYPDIDESTE